MKKLLISGLLLLLIIFGFATIALGAESDNVTGGPGLGIPYGIIGGNLEVGFLDYFAVCAGLGLSPEGLGWCIGGRIYLAGSDSRVRPRLGYYRGIVGAVEYAWNEYEDVKGNAAGLGMLIRINDRISIDGELIYIASWDYPDEEPDSRYKISVGARFAL